MSQTPTYRNELIASGLSVRFPDMTKDAIANESPVCYQTMERILAGRNVSVDTLAAFVVDFLGARLIDVFDPDLTERQFHRRLLANGNRRVAR